jgi:hypothetical protein
MWILEALSGSVRITSQRVHNMAWTSFDALVNCYPISAHYIASLPGRSARSQWHHPFGDAPFLSSIDSPASLSFLRCAMSQLYTRANATSSVCFH